MTTAPRSNNDTAFSSNARKYLLSLRNGQKPDIRPEFGAWEPIVRKVELAFDSIEKPIQRAKLMPKMIESIGKLKRFQRLSTLLTDQSTEQGEQVVVPLMPALPKEAIRPTGLLPKVSPFLRDYIEYSKECSPEGFEAFHVAGALWLLSTVAAHRIQVPLRRPLSTPLSIVLCARSGLFAKTTTADVAKAVLKEARLDILLGDDETTPQKLLFDMAGNIPTNYNELDDELREEVRYKLAMSAQLGWYYDEFNQLVDAMRRPGPMAEYAGLLRKFDNCPDEYRYSTKSGGLNKIKKPYLAFMGSTTPANIAKHAGKNSEMWNDGFWARMLFVCPDPTDFKTETMDDGILDPPASVVQALKDWNNRLGMPACSISEKIDDKGNGTGKFTAQIEPLPVTTLVLSPEAKGAFNAYRLALRGLIATNKMQDLDGSYVRLPIMAMRIAALIASLENNNYLTLDIWNLAQEITETFRENLHRLYAQISLPVEDEGPSDALLAFLKTKPAEQGVTVRQIVQLGPPELRRMKTDGVRALLQSLERDGLVKCQKSGKKECYLLAPSE